LEEIPVHRILILIYVGVIGREIHGLTLVFPPLPVGLAFNSSSIRMAMRFLVLSLKLVIAL